MKKPLQSKALEVNLTQTQQSKIVFEEKYEWLLGLSANYWGIHERTLNFFNEYHHPYANQKLISDDLRRLFLGDFWFYAQCSEKEKALRVILGIFQDTLEKNKSSEVFETVYPAFIEFLALNAKLENQDVELLKDGLRIVNKWVAENHPVVLRNSTFFKNQLGFLHTHEILGKDFFLLLHTLTGNVIHFWADTSDVEIWYKKNREYLSKGFSSELKNIGKPFFDKLIQKWERTTSFEEIDKELPLYLELTEYFTKHTDTFEVITDRFYFILYLMHMPGMAHIKNKLLVDLNSLIKKIFSEIKPEQVGPFMDNIFSLFHELHKEHSSTVLDCVSTMGKEIIHSNHEENVQKFVQKLIALPFVVPGQLRLSSEWRTMVDPSHIKNIRVWLELFETAPDQYYKLIAALTVNLKLKGIFIFDTDLFQKDVTALLNSDIHPYFRMVKQLCRIFPVYFNEIGAEGELRDITTAIDELTSRQDKLIHFLRKQVHIESNNTHIDLTRKIFNFWVDGDITPLKPLLPLDVLDGIDPKGKWVVPMQKLIAKIADKAHVKNAANLLEEHPDKIDKWVGTLPGESQVNKKRLMMLCRLYYILIEKYSFSAVNITKSIRKYNFIPLNDVDTLEDLMNKKNREDSLKYIFKFIGILKKIILYDEKTEGWENIYHKRHVAFGIPSMYGEYHERRFEALGLIYKLEQAALLIMDEWVKSINLNYITAKTLEKIEAVMELYKEGLLLDGIENPAFNSNLSMFNYSLKSQSFSLGQYTNIFGFMGENIREIIHKYFFRPYEEVLKIVIPQMRATHDDPGPDGQNFLHLHSEAFYRDMLSSSFMLQSLDNFIAAVLTSLRNMVDNFSSDKIRDIMSYNPDMVISTLYDQSKNIDNQVYIGSKAYYLKKLYSLGYPVPPGFVITTEVFRRKETILQNKIMSREIDNMIMAQIKKLEKMTCREFGNPQNPLMLSVRSGTAVSMPGAMNTFLNVGINEQIIEALSKQPNYGWTSWDCYRRFLQSWGMASGLSRDTFDQIMIDFKTLYKVKQKVQFTPEQMKEISFAYRDVLKQNHIHIEEEVFPQIRQAILNVFDSWNSDRAIVYRKHLQIADEWGTAVVIQKMVLGNINYTSGTGVVFTHNPHLNKPGVHLYGDYSLVSQGEDVVGGLVHVLPISRNQTHGRAKENSLEENFPQIYKRIYDLACQLTEKHGFGHQEIEFTFESERMEDFYILQTRDQDVRPKDKTQQFALSGVKMKLLGQGIGIGGGAMNGILIFDTEDMQKMRQKFPNKKLILVRPDTVPDDIGIIFGCDGLLTARGGATSHAAVTAARLGKICIVNCTDLVVYEREKKCVIKKQVLNVGDEIAMDGTFGNIYKGNYPMMQSDSSGIKL
ncbi:MAG TPA: PEP/pyruvate-binding domain-containing protein [Bacteroidales bacterium]|nr:PEP/pyruvate-binding domain-containing protein [Bacteroidales bacterium]